MNAVLSIIVAMLCVYGFYAALSEIRTFLRHTVHKRQMQIDKTGHKEYNNTHKDGERMPCDGNADTDKQSG